MEWIPFLMAALVLAVMPGPGITYVVARTIAGGRAEGLASCLGASLGGLIHVLAAALGFSALVAQSAWAFSIVKYVGAAYLFYLGVRVLMSRQSLDAPVAVSAQGVRRALMEGIVVEALNVKTAIFFLAFLPQFASPDMPLIYQLVLLGCICVGLNTLADVVAVLGTHQLLTSRQSGGGAPRWLSRLSGTTLLGLGFYMAVSDRR